MSLDVLSSKQIDINCSSLSTNTASISDGVSIGGNLLVKNIAVSNDIDVGGIIYCDTKSDALVLEHARNNGINGSSSYIVNIKKHYGANTYEIGDIVRIDLTISSEVVHNLNYICNTTTSRSPPHANWTYIGVLFSDTQIYPSTITNVIHNGFSYNAITTNPPIPSGPFNVANWTLNGLAHSNIDNNSILQQNIDSSGCDIIIGANSKDYNGMLKLVSGNSSVSEIQSLTGNIVLNRPVLNNSNPTNYNDKAVMYYDTSGDLVTVLSRDDDLHVNGYIFRNHTKSNSNNFTIMNLTQTVITEPGPILKRYGNMNTDIVNIYGLNIRTDNAGYQSCGSATLGTGGTVAISTKACGANSKIFLSLTSTSLGHLRVTNKTQTGFTVTSSNTADASATFDWMLINPDFTP